MPITLIAALKPTNYLEYRINNRTVRYDIVMSRHSHQPQIWKIRQPRQPWLPSICYIKKQLPYPYYPNVDKFCRKIK
jgi:hypothetical protein